MKFLKYRHNWCHSEGKWESKLLSMGDEISVEDGEELAESLASEHNWSDKYRGVEWEIVNYPGNEWMKDQLRRVKQSLKYKEKLLGEYTALLYRNGGS